MNENQKKAFYAMFFVISFLCGVFATKFYFSLGENVSDVGNGAYTVTEQLGEAKFNQSNITDGIRQSESGLESISSGISESQEIVNNVSESVSNSASSNARAREEVKESGRIIAESQSILARVQERGSVKTESTDKK